METDPASKPDVIYIRDRGEPLPLYPCTINGVKVYAPSEEKTAELEERFARLRLKIPPISSRPSFFRAFGQAFFEILIIIALVSLFFFLFPSLIH